MTSSGVGRRAVAEQAAQDAADRAVVGQDGVQVERDAGVGDEPGLAELGDRERDQARRRRRSGPTPVTVKNRRRLTRTPATKIAQPNATATASPSDAAEHDVDARCR